MMANNTISQTALQTAPSRKRAGNRRRGRPLMQWDKIATWITKESSKVSKLAETYDSGHRIGYVGGIMAYPVLGARLRKASCSHSSRLPPKYRCKKKHSPAHTYSKVSDKIVTAFTNHYGLHRQIRKWIPRKPLTQ